MNVPCNAGRGEGTSACPPWGAGQVYHSPGSAWLTMWCLILGQAWAVSRWPVTGPKRVGQVEKRLLGSASDPSHVPGMNTSGVLIGSFIPKYRHAPCAWPLSWGLETSQALSSHESLSGDGC